MKSRGYEHFWGRPIATNKKNIIKQLTSESIKGKSGKSMQIAKK